MNGLAAQTTNVALIAGAITDQSRDFALGISIETISNVLITVTPGVGLTVSDITWGGTIVSWRMSAVTAGTYRCDVFAVLSDGERLGHRVVVTVG